MFGVRPQRSFKEAATKYLEENLHKRSIATDAKYIKKVMPYIGHLPLESVHQRTLRPFIDANKANGLKSNSTNIALGVVRRILNLAATDWRDENDLTWLSAAPKIRMLRVTDARDPYPLAWNEQARLLKELPAHLARMALFKVNTGLRDAEVCALRWEWQVPIPELSTSVFIIPKEWTKNGRDRLVVLNSVARSVLKEVRGEHPQFVLQWVSSPLASPMKSRIPSTS